MKRRRSTRPPEQLAIPLDGAADSGAPPRGIDVDAAPAAPPATVPALRFAALEPAHTVNPLSLSAAQVLDGNDRGRGVAAAA
jgi:hypothetical protein